MLSSKVSYPVNTRSLSVQNVHKKHSVSILKDPSKSKLKHNRSVRFLEPEDFSSEESLENKSVCQQQTKEIPKPLNKFFIRDYLNFFNRETFNSQQNPRSKKQVEEKKIVKNPKKMSEKGKSKPGTKPGFSSTDPGFEPKVINFQFRDKNFYAKLNKFIKGKESVSPVRNGESKVKGKLK